MWGLERSSRKAGCYPLTLDFDLSNLMPPSSQVLDMYHAAKTSDSEGISLDEFAAVMRTKGYFLDQPVVGFEGHQ